MFLPFATALLLGTAAPAPLPQDSSDKVVRVRENLECAAMYAAAMGDDKTSAEDKNSFGLLMSYFLGRAQGLDPQLDIKQAFTASLIENVSKNIDVIGKRCTALSTEFGNDLQAAGKAIEAAGATN